MIVGKKRVFRALSELFVQFSQVTIEEFVYHDLTSNYWLPRNKQNQANGGLLVISSYQA